MKKEDFDLEVEAVEPLIAEKMWDKIYGQTFRKKHRRLFFIKWSSIAAIFIGLVFSVVYFIDAAQQENDSDLLSLKNNSKKDMLCYLPDSSIVRLFPNSSIVYSFNQDLQQRIINLNGKAVFEVFKDKEHPFFVRTRDIEVRALGTIFLVDENAKEGLKVKLIEGKISITNVATTALSKKPFTENLIAGQSLLVHLNSDGPSVEKIETDYTSPTADVGIQGKRFVSKYVDNDFLDFKEEKLIDVFAVLARVYKQPIDCPKAHLDKFYFTGAFKSSDSLDSILKMITKLNGLHYEYQDQQIKILF